MRCVRLEASWIDRLLSAKNGHWLCGWENIQCYLVLPETRLALHKPTGTFICC